MFLISAAKQKANKKQKGKLIRLPRRRGKSEDSNSSNNKRRKDRCTGSHACMQNTGWLVAAVVCYAMNYAKYKTGGKCLQCLGENSIEIFEKLGLSLSVQCFFFSSGKRSVVQNCYYSHFQSNYQTEPFSAFLLLKIRLQHAVTNHSEKENWKINYEYQ